MTRLLSLALIPLLAVTALAQDLVTYSDGAQRVGRLEKRRGQARLKTTFGERRDSVKAVAKTEDAAPLLEAYRFQAEGLPPANLRAHQALARWCHQKGCLPGLREQLEKILALDPTDEVAAGIIKQLAAEFTVAPGEREPRPREQRAAAKFLFETYARRGTLEAALTEAKAAAFDPALRFRYAMSSINSRHGALRLIAARMLESFRKEPGRINPLYKRALADPEPAVRHAATESLAVCDDLAFVRLFAKNLSNPKQAIRMNAADALATLGKKEAIEPLLAAMAGAWSPPRRNITDTTQRAYVKDFDVEIAQAAVIADPIVDVVQEGTVLDVAVVSVSIERRHYHRALARLSGVDFGRDVGRWRAWFEKQKKAEAQREQKPSRAARRSS